MAVTSTTANFAGALIVFVILAVLDSGEDLPTNRTIELVVVFVATLVGTGALASTIIARWANPLIVALRAGEPIVGDVRRILFRIPARTAVISVLMWAVAGVLFGFYSAARLGLSASEAALLGLTIVLGGVTTAAFCYLLLEIRLRPVIAKAFADEEPDRPSGIGVAHRLVLVWLLGTGVPIVVAALFLVAPDSDPGDLQREVLPWLVVAWVAGLALAWRASRQIASPLAELRTAMTEVRTGGFEVRASVDDASEVGLLQSGFNSMVAGLQEREQLRDLFGRHVGTDVARRALTSGAVLGGVHADASALFVDVTDSTGLATRLDPAELVALLNDLFAVVVATVETEGGWVNKFQGDAALCVFGPPGGDTDHRRRALRAARALRRALDELAARHPELLAGIGVSSGTVVAGNVGSEQRYEYTVIGDPVNEAARLTELAKEAGGLLVSAATVAGAGPDEGAHWRAGPEVVLRGRGAPTLLYEPSAATPVD